MARFGLREMPAHRGPVHAQIRRDLADAIAVPPIRLPQRAIVVTCSPEQVRQRRPVRLCLPTRHISDNPIRLMPRDEHVAPQRDLASELLPRTGLPHALVKFQERWSLLDLAPGHCPPLFLARGAFSQPAL